VVSRPDVYGERCHFAGHGLDISGACYRPGDSEAKIETDMRIRDLDIDLHKPCQSKAGSHKAGKATYAHVSCSS
jgi:hypothetical protein